MKIINGHKYSKTPFEDYKFRVNINIIDIDDINDDEIYLDLNIYTTEVNSENIERDLMSIATDNVKFIFISEKYSKEQIDYWNESENKRINKYLNEF